MFAPKLDTKTVHHPAVASQFERRAGDAQLRLADRITAFARSMTFVYIHVLVFATWMIVLERSPRPTLTLAVPLEAIFLSTFVMIGQNRQAAFQQAKADHDYATVNRLLVENTELTRDIDALMQVAHAHHRRRSRPLHAIGPIWRPTEDQGTASGRGGSGVIGQDIGNGPVGTSARAARRESGCGVLGW
jgi:uncharacterized membrane protein